MNSTSSTPYGSLSDIPSFVEGTQSTLPFTLEKITFQKKNYFKTIEYFVVYLLKHNEEWFQVRRFYCSREAKPEDRHVSIENCRPLIEYSEHADLVKRKRHIFDNQYLPLKEKRKVEYLFLTKINFPDDVFCELALLAKIIEMKKKESFEKVDFTISKLRIKEDSKLILKYKLFEWEKIYKVKREVSKQLSFFLNNHNKKTQRFLAKIWAYHTEYLEHYKENEANSSPFYLKLKKMTLISSIPLEES